MIESISLFPSNTVACGMTFSTKKGYDRIVSEKIKMANNKYPLLLGTICLILVTSVQSKKWVFETVSQGKVPSLLPEEYATTFMQHKWDLDGFGVSHAVGLQVVMVVFA